jgi:excisionase family DNA binding protein
LRLGFFESERDARQVLETLRAEYPQAWVATASPGEASTFEVPADPEVLTLKEAAAFLQVDPLVLKDMVRRQGIPGRRIGVRWRFSRSALVAGSRAPMSRRRSSIRTRWSGRARQGQRTWHRESI